MAMHKDHTGERYGKLVMLSYEGNNKNRQALWKAQCDCGNETTVLVNKARRGHTTSCGCGAVNKPLDLAGQRFGKLTAIRPVSRNSSRAFLWECQCDCGSGVNVAGPKLKSGHTQSCGCRVLNHISSLNLTHGMSKSRTYRIWSAMKNRCANPSQNSYMNYGGRGIAVCDRWINSFENFLADMGEAPEGSSIERVDNNKGYSPDNCKWATRGEQQANKRPRCLFKKVKYLSSERTEP